MAIFIFSHWMSYEFPNLLVKLEKNTANHFGKILLVYEIYPLIIWSIIMLKRIMVIISMSQLYHLFHLYYLVPCMPHSLPPFPLLLTERRQHLLKCSEKNRSQTNESQRLVMGTEILWMLILTFTWLKKRSILIWRETLPWV